MNTSTPIDETPSAERKPVDETPSLEHIPIDGTLSAELAPVDGMACLDCTNIDESLPAERAPIDERPPARDEPLEPRLGRLTRRGFALGGVAALAGVAGWQWLVTRSDEDGLPWPLRRVLRAQRAPGASGVPDVAHRTRIPAQRGPAASRQRPDRD